MNITLNVLHKQFVSLPSVDSGATLTLTIRKATGGTLTGGTFDFVAGKEWLLTFTPATLNEVYGVVVTDADGDVVFSESYKALGQVWDAVTGPAGNIVVGTNSFCTAQEAEDYFATRMSVDAWDDATDDNQIRALITAYNQLVNSGLFSFPATTTNAIKYAQCEQALFLLQQGDDIDSRRALQAQGVVEAGIVKEKYSGDLQGVAICANARAFLKDYAIEDNQLFVGDVNRDEEESADTIIEEDNP